jgi:hypothetical protein
MRQRGSQKVGGGHAVGIQNGTKLGLNLVLQREERIVEVSGFGEDTAGVLSARVV